MCIVYCNSGHKYSNSTDEYIPYQYFDHICPVLDNIYICTTTITTQSYCGQAKN